MKFPHLLPLCHVRIIGSVIAGALVLGTVASVGADAASGQASTRSLGTHATAPRQGGTLRVITLGATPTLDPLLTSVSTTQLIGWSLFNTLVTSSRVGGVDPALARTWRITPDGKTYVFSLRNNVRFQNGEKMTAKDVVFTINRARTLEGSLMAPLLSPIRSVKASDQFEVTVKLKRPYSPLLSVLANVAMSIVPRTAAQSPDFGTHPIGTGPFALKEWTQGQGAVVVRNRYYWKPGLPHLDQITFITTPDPNTRYSLLASGAADFVYDIPVALKSKFSSTPNVAVVGGKGSVSYLYMDLNIQKKPFNDVRVRQAIFSALNSKQLASLCLPGASEPLPSGFMPLSFWAAPKKPVWRQNIAKARSLLTAAGYPSGFSMEIKTVNALPFASCTAQAIEQQLGQAGIKVSVVMLDPAGIAAAQSNTDLSSAGAVDALIYGRLGVPDPDLRFSQGFTTGAPQNWMKYSDPKLDSLIRQATSAQKRPARAALYAAASERLALLGPTAFLFNYQKFDAYNTSVRGYKWNPFVVYNTFDRIWLAK